MYVCMSTARLNLQLDMHVDQLYYSLHTIALCTAGK